jgi:hypothetical protein
MLIIAPAGEAITGRAVAGVTAQHFLCFFPLPQGQGSFLPGFIGASFEESASQYGAASAGATPA